MAVAIYDCPHCNAKTMSFTIWGEHINGVDQKTLTVVGACNACGESVEFLLLRKNSGIGAGNITGDILKSDHFHLLNAYPEPAPVAVPADVPEPVGKAFGQAAGSRRDGRYDAACAMYRKAMELGLKAFSPDVEAWKIEKRIDQLASRHRITPDLQAWAHELRLDGNDALHGDEEANKEMCDQMHDLCRFLLTYLYTLPKQVEAAKARRG